jgi:transcriptional regulator with XRE-family HTH domain
MRRQIWQPSFAWSWRPSLRSIRDELYSRGDRGVSRMAHDLATGAGAATKAASDLRRKVHGERASRHRKTQAANSSSCRARDITPAPKAASLNHSWYRATKHCVDAAGAHDYPGSQGRAIGGGLFMRRRRRAPRSIDAHVGARVRTLRTLAGMSQTQLGAAAGITFQQVQKYENGANRISASRLYAFSRALEVPVSHFFEGIGESRASAEDAELVRRATLELVRYYYMIPDTVRRALFETVKSIARAGTEKS